MRKNIVKLWWDERGPSTSGWYYEVVTDGIVVDDSVKVWAEVDVEDYGLNDLDELVKALESKYPCHEVEYNA